MIAMPVEVKAQIRRTQTEKSMAPEKSMGPEKSSGSTDKAGAEMERWSISSCKELQIN